MKQIDLKLCEYSKKTKVLKIASEYFGMPSEFSVVSHHTGKVVHFKSVQPGDELFDEDCYDGEYAFYRPVEPIPNVKHFVIYHAY